jgi:hypothetical protein
VTLGDALQCFDSAASLANRDKSTGSTNGTGQMPGPIPALASGEVGKAGNCYERKMPAMLTEIIRNQYAAAMQCCAVIEMGFLPSKGESHSSR